MRKVIVALAVLIASSAFAQQKNELALFHAEGPGVAFSRMVTPNISAQLAVAWERHQSYPYVVTPTGAFVPVDAVRFRTHPIDLSVRYHWLNDTRFKPFVGIGARYVGAPNISVDSNVVRRFDYRSHFGPEIVGGMSFQLTKSLGALIDGKAYFGDRESYDNPWKTSLGLVWRF